MARVEVREARIEVREVTWAKDGGGMSTDLFAKENKNEKKRI